VERVLWSPDGAQLAFMAAPGGGMNTQVHLVRPDGSGLRRLTDGGRERNRLSAWTHDGRSLAIASNRRHPDAVDACLVDAATGAWPLVAETPGNGYLADVSRDRRHALLYRCLQRGTAISASSTSRAAG